MPEGRTWRAHHHHRCHGTAWRGYRRHGWRPGRLAFIGIVALAAGSGVASATLAVTVIVALLLASVVLAAATMGGVALLARRMARSRRSEHSRRSRQSEHSRRSEHSRPSRQDEHSRRSEHSRSRRPATPPPGPDWATSQRRFDALRAEYAEYECDPLAVLRLPALADVTVPATARFVDAFAAAQALHTDREPPPDMAAEYQRAVDRADRAWRAAREAAERIRLAGLSESERASVHRAVKLLTLAQGCDNAAERQIAYSKARDEMAKLERLGRPLLPRAARAALDECARAGLAGSYR